MLEVIHTIPSFPSLAALDVSCNPILASSTIEHLGKALAQWPRLTTLKLRDIYSNEATISHFFQLLGR